MPRPKASNHWRQGIVIHLVICPLSEYDSAMADGDSDYDLGRLQLRPLKGKNLEDRPPKRR